MKACMLMVNHLFSWSLPILKYAIYHLLKHIRSHDQIEIRSCCVFIFTLIVSSCTIDTTIWSTSVFYSVRYSINKTLYILITPVVKSRDKFFIGAPLERYINCFLFSKQFHGNKTTIKCGFTREDLVFQIPGFCR